MSALIANVLGGIAGASIGIGVVIRAIRSVKPRPQPEGWCVVWHHPNGKVYGLANGYASGYAFTPDLRRAWAFDTKGRASAVAMRHKEAQGEHLSIEPWPLLR